MENSIAGCANNPIRITIPFIFKSHDLYCAETYLLTTDALYYVFLNIKKELLIPANLGHKSRMGGSPVTFSLPPTPLTHPPLTLPTPTPRTNTCPENYKRYHLPNTWILLGRHFTHWGVGWGVGASFPLIRRTRLLIGGPKKKYPFLNPSTLYTLPVGVVVLRRPRG